MPRPDYRLDEYGRQTDRTLLNSAEPPMISDGLFWIGLLSVAAGLMVGVLAYCLS